MLTLLRLTCHTLMDSLIGTFSTISSPSDHVLTILTYRPCAPFTTTFLPLTLSTGLSHHVGILRYSGNSTSSSVLTVKRISSSNG